MANEPLLTALNGILENIKKAREAVKQNDTNSVAWYLDLAEKHAHAAKQAVENEDPSG